MKRALLVIVAACAAQGGDGATFRVTYPDAPPAGTRAKVGKRFYAKPVGQCSYPNGRDARWAITGAHVASDELPPGITIEDGALTGTPTSAGEFAAHIELTGVTCAGTPYPNQALDVRISVR